MVNYYSGKLLKFIIYDSANESSSCVHFEDFTASDLQANSQGIMCESYMYDLHILHSFKKYISAKCCKFTAKSDEIILKYPFRNLLNQTSTNFQIKFIHKKMNL